MRGWGHGKTKQVCEGTAGTGRTDDAERQERYDPQRAAICSIAERIGCSAETLRNRGRRTEREARRRPGLPNNSALRSKSRRLLATACRLSRRSRQTEHLYGEFR